MSLHVPVIWSERERKKRNFINPLDSLSLDTIIWPAVKSSRDSIQAETVAKAMKILETIYNNFASHSLYIDAFQTTEWHDPARKLFIAWELVRTTQDRECYWDVVIHNRMNFLQGNLWERFWNYIWEPTKMSIELPLWEFADVTRETIEQIWGDIDWIVKSKHDDWFIAYISRANNIEGEMSSHWRRALQQAWLWWLSQKPLIWEDPLLADRLVWLRT